MSLQAKLDAFKADFKGGKAPYFAPPEIHPIMERATAELIASGQAREEMVQVELAVKADGTFLGMKAKLTMDAGAYPNVPFVSAMFVGLIQLLLPGPYRMKGYRFESSVIYGIFAPTGTNPDIVAKVNKALQIAMKSKDLYEQVVNEGGEPLFMSPQEYKKQLAEDANKWSSLIRKLNLKIEN